MSDKAIDGPYTFAQAFWDQTLKGFIVDAITPILYFLLICLGNLVLLPFEAVYWLFEVFRMIPYVFFI